MRRLICAFPRQLKLLTCATLALWAFGCAEAGGGDNADPASENTTTGEQEQTNQTGTTEQTGEGTEVGNQPVTCSAQPAGALNSSEGYVIYQNHSVEAAATHGAGGCLNGLDATWSIDGGCQLVVSIESEGTSWTIAGATFLPDDKCGADYPVTGSYTFDPNGSTAVILNAPAATTENAEECLTTTAMTLLGRLVFTGPETEPLELYLEGLGIQGDVASKRTEIASCPVAPELCVDTACGLDGYGKGCGECSGDMVCDAGACVASLCPPKGPYGTLQNTTMQDVVLEDCNGDLVAFHDLCGSNAGYVNLFAAW